MENLKTLVLMQLKDKVDFSFIKSKKQTIFKVVLSILKFAIITTLIYFGFYILSYLRLVSILPGIPQNFFALVFTLMIILSIIVCTFGLMKNLYFSKDNQLLLTLPASRSAVFTSKLVVYYLYELIRNVYYILPLFIAYSLINQIPIYYYIWIVLIYFVITLVPVALGALFSIPLMFVSIFLKQYKVLQAILLVVFIAGIVTGLVFLINAIPENFDLIGTWGTTFWQIQDFLNKFNLIFTPFGWLAISAIGERYGVSNIIFSLKQFLITLGVVAFIAIVLTITYLLVRPLFFKMASSPFEYKKVKIVKNYKNYKTSFFWSSIKKDLLLNLRTPAKLYSLIEVVIGMPLAIFLLNKIYSAMDTRLTGAFMSVAFNILMILIIALSSNIEMAHIYSEDGASSYLLKTVPQKNVQTLFSKLVVNLVLVSISILVSTFIFTSFVNYSIWQSILIFLTLELTYVGHLLWSAELDIMNPQTAQYQTTGTHTNNPNEIKSSILSFLISALIAFVTFFFITENQYSVWYKILFIATLFCIGRIWLYVNKIKVYYKEKQ